MCVYVCVCVCLCVYMCIIIRVLTVTCEYVLSVSFRTSWNFCCYNFLIVCHKLLHTYTHMHACMHILIHREGGREGGREGEGEGEGREAGTSVLVTLPLSVCAADPRTITPEGIEGKTIYGLWVGKTTPCGCGWNLNTGYMFMLGSYGLKPVMIS